MRVMARQAGQGPTTANVAGRLHEAYGLVTYKHGVVNANRAGLDHAGEPVAASAQAELFVSRPSTQAELDREITVNRPPPGRLDVQTASPWQPRMRRWGSGSTHRARQAHDPM